MRFNFRATFTSSVLAKIMPQSSGARSTLNAAMPQITGGNANSAEPMVLVSTCVIAQIGIPGSSRAICMATTMDQGV